MCVEARVELFEGGLLPRLYFSTGEVMVRQEDVLGLVLLEAVHVDRSEARARKVLLDLSLRFVEELTIRCLVSTSAKMMGLCSFDAGRLPLRQKCGTYTSGLQGQVGIFQTVIGLESPVLVNIRLSLLLDWPVIGALQLLLCISEDLIHGSPVSLRCLRGGLHDCGISFPLLGMGFCLLLSSIHF